MPSSPDPTPIPSDSAASGAGGNHRARWIVLVVALVALAVVGILAVTRGSRSSVQPAAALGPHPAVRIHDGQLVTRAGRPVRLLGVDVTGTESTCIAGRQVAGATFDDAEAKAIRSWHVDAVRVPLNEDCWLGINGVTAQLSATAYRTLIKRWVAALNRAGIVAILDLHWAAPGGYVADREWPMADADHSIAFWSQVAATFAFSPGVVFDLYNEPTLGNPSPSSDSWGCWLHGCDTTTTYSPYGAPASVRYRTAGMQQLLDAVRGAGAHQPILIAGLNYANNPCTRWAGGIVGSRCTVLTRLPIDPDHQLGLSFHLYNWTACQRSACWNSIDHLTSAARIPLVTTEFGEDDCTDDFMHTYMSWADANRVSYLAWTWMVNVHRACVPSFADQGADLSLLQSWNGTPSRVSPEAAPLRAHLATQLR